MTYIEERIISARNLKMSLNKRIQDQEGSLASLRARALEIESYIIILEDVLG